MVVPDDVEIQIKYADVLLKEDSVPEAADLRPFKSMMAF